MDDGEFTTLTAAQLVRLALLLAFAVLVVVGVGMILRVEKPARPFAAPGPAGVAASARAGAGPVQDAALKRAGEILFGGGLDTNDPAALNKSVGEPVALRTRESELTVTPTRVAAGTSACAAGPLVTIDLLVESASGPEGLSLNDFILMAVDGSAARPIQECSTGFAEGAAGRTLTFAATQPDRLIFGKDPAVPVAMWHLS